VSNHSRGYKQGFKNHVYARILMGESWV